MLLINVLYAVAAFWPQTFFYIYMYYKYTEHTSVDLLGRKRGDEKLGAKELHRNRNILHM